MALPGQVNENLPKPARVSKHSRRNRRVEIAGQFQIFCRRTDAQNLQHRLNRLAQIKFDRFEFQLPGFNLGKVQNIVQNPQE